MDGAELESATTLGDGEVRRSRRERKPVTLSPFADQVVPKSRKSSRKRRKKEFVSYVEPDDDVEEVSEEIESCGKCSNCAARNMFPTLLQVSEAQCLKAAVTLGEKDITVAIRRPVKFTVDNSLPGKVWDIPDYLQLKAEKLYTLAVPLSRKTAPFVLTKPGWRRITAIEENERQKK